MMDRKELKELATKLGVEFHNNISTDALTAKVEEKQMEAKAAGYEMPETEEVETKSEAKSKSKKEPEIYRPAKHKSGLGKRMDANRLVRCIIVPLDEDMRDIQSEMYSVGTQATGFVKKVVMFNEETLEPLAIVKHLKGKKMLMQVDRGNGKAKLKEDNSAFNITILPDYTEAELADLFAKGRTSKN